MVAQRSYSGLIALGLTAMLSFFVLSANSASAQSNTAAGVTIIQNNQMRKELQETKAELKAIREGLGIESGNVDASTSQRSESELIWLQAVGIAAVIIFLGIPTALVLSYVMRNQSCYLAAGNIDAALASAMLRAIVPPLMALLLSPFVVIVLLRLSAVPTSMGMSLKSGVQLWVLGFFAWIGFACFCFLSRTRWRRQLLRKAKELRQRSATA